MVIVRSPHHREFYDMANSILRPYKQKFPRGKINGARACMTHKGVSRLRYFRIQPKVRYETYFCFETWRNRYNYLVPPIGRTIRVCDYQGNLISRPPRRMSNQALRVKYKTITFEQQLVAAFHMLDLIFPILEEHLLNSTRIRKKHIPTPDYIVPVRYRVSNFPQFLTMKLISFLTRKIFNPVISIDTPKFG